MPLTSCPKPFIYSLFRIRNPGFPLRINGQQGFLKSEQPIPNISDVHPIVHLCNDITSYTQIYAFQLKRAQLLVLDVAERPNFSMYVSLENIGEADFASKMYTNSEMRYI